MKKITICIALCALVAFVLPAAQANGPPEGAAVTLSESYDSTTNFGLNAENLDAQITAASSATASRLENSYVEEQILADDEVWSDVPQTALTIKGGTYNYVAVNSARHQREGLEVAIGASTRPSCGLTHFENT